MPDDRLKQSLEHPFHRYLGVENIESKDGRGSLTFKVDDPIINLAGVLHGGATYALCDICAYAGLLSLLGEDEEAVTHDVHFSMLQSARAGDVVKLSSQVLKKGRTLCFIDVRAWVRDRLIATAMVTKSLVKRPALSG